jgi:hypothetical protein
MSNNYFILKIPCLTNIYFKIFYNIFFSHKTLLFDFFNFSIFENNIIGVKAAKVLYLNIFMIIF